MGHDLEGIARALVAPGKGILAADESGGTIKKRFDSIGIESTEDSRRAYRDMLFTTEGSAEHVSGVILYDETIRQQALDGTPFPKLLEADRGHPRDQGRHGREGPRERPGREDHRGARRPARAAGRVLRARRALHQVARRDHDRRAAFRASTASGRTRTRSPATRALSQEAGLVPIIEPEVLMDGDHSIETAFEVTSRTLHAVFTELRDQRVQFEQMLLKPNMVLSGYEAPNRAGVQEVAEQTIRCFRRHVPAAVPGIVFLSGGQTDEDATAHLNAMNAMGPHPWELSFSYGRALQAPALKAWGGDPANVAAGQAAYLHRAKMNGLARVGLATRRTWRRRSRRNRSSETFGLRDSIGSARRRSARACPSGGSPRSGGRCPSASASRSTRSPPRRPCTGRRGEARRP